MAATIIPDFTNIALSDDGGGDNPDESADWSGFKLAGGGGASITVAFDSGAFIQGNRAASFVLSNKKGWLYYDYSGIGSFDFTGADAGKLVWIWGNVLTSGLMATRAGGGISVVLSAADTTNYSEWYVDGSDTYSGGWKRYVIDPRKPPSAIGGTGADLTAISYFGLAGDTRPNSPRVDAVVVDRIDVGNGLRVIETSSDPVTDGFGYWQDILDADEGDSDNKYGVVRSDNEIIYVQGTIILGDNKGNRLADLKERDRIIVWENPVYYDLPNLSVVSTLPTDSNKLIVAGSPGAEGSTPTTDIEHGVKIGSGDSAVGANGCQFQSAGPQVSVLVSGGAGGQQADTLNYYGCKFLNLDGIIHPVEVASHEFIGNTVDQCNTISAGAAVQRANVYSGVSVSASRNIDLRPFPGGALASQSLSAALIYEDGKTDIKNSQFNANSYGGAIIDIYNGVDIYANAHGIQHREKGDQVNITYDNLTFSGNDKDILYTAWDKLIIEATNGSNPTTWVKTSGGTVDIQLSATLTITDIVASGNSLIQDDRNREGSEVRIYETGTQNEISGIENIIVIDKAETGLFEFTYNAATVPNVDIVVHHVEFEYFRIDDFEPGDASQSLPVAQQYDRNYDNP
jgi:hypothetical protein